MSRIIAGAAAGRPLTSVPGTGTRPTTDRTKEALFSWLEARDWLDGTAVLDLFAGSGALGCEAASRGAASVMLVERERRAVAACRAQGGRVIAVGTTSVRSLESAARDGELKAFAGETDIFLYPGRPFHVVDALVTNFHLPESTLLMLVSAFAGYPETMAAYAEAVAQRYRFFSYGDAMFITRNPAARGPEETR